MEPMDDKLINGLAQDPLIQTGFSESIKSRIRERLTVPKRDPRRWIAWTGGIGAALIAAALLLSADWHMKESLVVLGDKYEAKVSLFKANEGQVNIRSAVLLGLRTDHRQPDGTDYSTYRTLLLANDQGEMQKIAEGDGILMPYKNGFMKIMPTLQQIANEQAVLLSATPDSVLNKPRAQETLSTGAYKLSEKLLFAGNRYLSVEQTVHKKDQDKELQYEYVWVKDLQNMSGNPARTMQNPVEDPHVSMQALYGDSVQARLKALHVNRQQEQEPVAGPASMDDKGESWTIVRQRGQWVPQVASYTNREENHTFKYQLQDVPISLPYAVVSYDRLTADWNEIRRLRPDAKDAFSSPNNELFGVITDSDISIYMSEGHVNRSPLMTLNLAANESIVMIQWAVDEPFIQLWKEKVKALLNN